MSPLVPHFLMSIPTDFIIYFINFHQLYSTTDSPHYISWLYVFEYNLVSTSHEYMIQAIVPKCIPFILPVGVFPECSP